jgi:predicted DNA repair protein MutK
MQAVHLDRRKALQIALAVASGVCGVRALSQSMDRWAAIEARAKRRKFFQRLGRKRTNAYRQWVAAEVSRHHFAP